MLSKIKNIFSYFTESERDEQENVRDILVNIRNHDEVPTINFLSSDDRVDVLHDDFRARLGNVTRPNVLSEEEESVVKEDSDPINISRAVGKVTRMDHSFGLIDDLLRFKLDQIVPSAEVKEGDMVSYSFKECNLSNSKVIVNIFGRSDDVWDEPDTNEVNSNETEIMRNIQCRVRKRDRRQVMFEETSIVCDLDKIEATIIPIPGDWVELNVVAKLDHDAVDQTGDIIKVVGMRPLRRKRESGQITGWSKNEGEGRINKDVYVSKEICVDGYIPDLGDKVFFEAVESDQGRCSWRAIAITPNSSGKLQKFSNKSLMDSQKLVNEKNGISLTGNTSVSLHYNQTTTLKFKLLNKGDCEQTLLKMYSPRSHIKIKSPLVNNIAFQPGRSLDIILEITAKNMGRSYEQFVVNFKNFIIGCTIDIEVLAQEEFKRIVDCRSQSTTSRNHQSAYSANKVLTSGNRLYGEKVHMGSHFQGQKLLTFKLPEHLVYLVLGDDGLKKKKEEIEQAIEEYAPYLKEDICYADYEKRFHLLIYLEQIASTIALRRYDMKQICMIRKGEYITVEVPGLTEQRPSLIVGDRVVVSQPWSEDNSDYVGYIHKVLQKEVFVKFHPNFHNKYDESECDVHFEYSHSLYQKFHNAVYRVHRNFGSDWLFPLTVTEKPDQLIISDEVSIVQNPVVLSPSVLKLFGNSELSEAKPKPDKIIQLKDLEAQMLKQSSVNQEVSSSTHEKPPLEEDVIRLPPLDFKNTEIDENGFVIEDVAPFDGKIKWFNSFLNVHQKAAVINILRGKGRPLPYVIFGPPGTGKTVTLVETILQVLRLLPHSRILAACPSNSAADLVCERLIDSGLLKPGELARLMSYNRLLENNIQEFLKPYCVWASDNTPAKTSAGSPFAPAVKPPSYMQVGRHRITVGTCGGLGSLLSMKFSPGHFTHVIVDESGQAVEPEIMIPLDKEKGQAILAGDPLQLGPVVSSLLASTFGLEESFLQRLTRRNPYSKDKHGFPDTHGYDPRLITRLTYNYRSVPEILNLPNQMFYDSELIPTVNPHEGREAEILRLMSNYLPFREEGTPAIVFHGVRGENQQEEESPSWFNPQEAWEATRYVQKCYEVGITDEEIGVITPYRSQVKKIHYLMTQLDMQTPKVGSVEDFQGQERNVIIISAVRSCVNFIKDDINSALGFISSPRRLNVSLTRPKALLIIIGNPHLLIYDPYWRSTLHYCWENKSYVGCDPPSELTCDRRRKSKN